MFKRIDHVELIPRDLDRTMDFYTNVLGFSVKSRKKMDREGQIKEIAYVTLGDTMVEMLDIKDAEVLEPSTSRAGYRIIALEVDNMEETIEFLKSKGIAPSLGPVTLGTSKRAEIKDPDGNSIELRQW